ncbi:MAG: argininosuccinate lyase [Prevotellaceae bacterium]|jgi:argininosuccinate lyase|nr:argininosuccinate lyase [Prevotellaceae bacterium]
MSSPLWSKGTSAHQKVARFTQGYDQNLDLVLAKHDIDGSLAHIKMLCSIGLLTQKELDLLSFELMIIREEVVTKNFIIEQDVEDVHSQIEILLTRKLGDVGKKIHSGRSRNDQIITDIKLYLREECRDITKEVRALFDCLQRLSEQHKDVLMPGYTHGQVAMPSSFGLWFGAYSETLIDDLQLLSAAYAIINQNPLGSAAGYGSSFPIDRLMTTQLLGFETLHYNVIAAQMSRGKTELSFAFALASIAATLGKFAADCCLYMCPNFGFISFPESLCTGSSIMPHKMNPDVWELIRARCSRVQSVPNEITQLCNHLPHGYHRDYQLLKEILFPAIGQLRECINMSEFMLSHLNVNQHILDDPKYDHLFTVEEVNRRVLQGIPFRDAYTSVGKEVSEGTFTATKNHHHTHIGSMGNLCTEEIRAKMEKVSQALLNPH